MKKIDKKGVRFFCFCHLLFYFFCLLWVFEFGKPPPPLPTQTHRRHPPPLCVSAMVSILGGFDIVEIDVQDREQVDSGEKVEAREIEEEDKTRTNNARSNM